MLKAIVSYSKKVPAETEYSSQGYSLSLETEIPETDPAAIHRRLGETFELVKAQVEKELRNGNGKTKPESSGNGPAAGKSREGRAEEVVKASNRQIKYITDLWTQGGGQISDLNARVREQFGLASMYELDRKQASALVDQLKREGRKAA